MKKCKYKQPRFAIYCTLLSLFFPLPGRRRDEEEAEMRISNAVSLLLREGKSALPHFSITETRFPFCMNNSFFILEFWKKIKKLE